MILFRLWKYCVLHSMELDDEFRSRRKRRCGIFKQKNIPWEGMGSGYRNKIKMIESNTYLEEVNNE